MGLAPLDDLEDVWQDSLPDMQGCTPVAVQAITESLS